MHLDQPVDNHIVERRQKLIYAFSRVDEFYPVDGDLLRRSPRQQKYHRPSCAAQAFLPVLIVPNSIASAQWAGFSQANHATQTTGFLMHSV